MLPTLIQLTKYLIQLTTILPQFKDFYVSNLDQLTTILPQLKDLYAANLDPVDEVLDPDVVGRVVEAAAVAAEAGAAARRSDLGPILQNLQIRTPQLRV
jgi:hypothetical protein